MPIPAAAYLVGASLLPKVIDWIGGKKDQRTGFERGIENKLRGIIEQGGIGLKPGQISSRYQQMIQQLQPMFKAQREAYNQDAAARGIYKSGVAFQKGQELASSQSKQMADILQNLTQWNEEMKLNSLLQALGLGSQVAGRGGDISRLSSAQNQGSFNQMYANLLGLMVDKGLFDF